MMWFIFVALWGHSLQANTISGVLYEKGSRKVLKNVNVFLLPQKLKSITDEKGRFVFENVQGEEIQIVVNQTGYLKLERNFKAQGLTKLLELRLERENYSTYESTTYSQRNKRDQSTKTLTQEQFLTVPGASGDPVKAVQNLPGVNRVAGFSSQVVIQGSDPNDTKYAIDGHDVPLVFHFGGLTSVVTPEAIKEVDYLSAAYGAEFGRAVGGVINLKTRDAEVDEVPNKGFVFVDTTKAGALYEIKLNDSSRLLVSGRYSYIGFVLRQVLKDNKDLALTVAPEFSDLNLAYQKKISDKDEFRLVSVVSKDSLGFLFKGPSDMDPGLRGAFENNTFFWRLIPQWKRELDDSSSVTMSVGLGENRISINIGDYFFDLKSYVISARGEWEKKYSKNWVSQFGFDNEYGFSQVELQLPIFRDPGGIVNPIGVSEVRQVGVNVKNSQLALYWRNQFQTDDERWSFVPALRFEHFKYLKRESYLDPRIALSWQTAQHEKLKAGFGVYHQVPEPPERDSTFGNPDIKAPRALHALLGWERDFKQGSSTGWALSVSAFDRWYDQLVVQSARFVERDSVVVPEVYNNSGKGRAYGLETLLKFDFASLSGWVSYTWSKSQRWDEINPVYDFEYDQTHNFNLVLSSEFANNWKISSRFRFVTGNPYTPVVGASFDADNDVFLPQRGPIYSVRQRDFQQLDVRVDKKWIYDSAISSLYCDIQNLLNAKNPESVSYSYDYSTQQTVDGLPILVSLGWKLEF
jgi:hypothetical protein